MTALILALALALGQVGTVAIGGTATWYAYHEGQAAAAHDLKVLLGPDWRGMLVRVTGPTGRSIIVRLTDSESSKRDGALIDLDDDDFAKLAPLSVGRITVTIEWPVMGVRLPDTSTVPAWTWPGRGPR